MNPETRDLVIAALAEAEHNRIEEHGEADDLHEIRIGMEEDANKIHLPSLMNAIQAYKSANLEWQTHWSEIIEHARKNLPSGSGINNGCTINVSQSSENKLVIFTSFHHMDSGGGYDGWTEHRILIRPDFIHGFSISISGPNRNDIKSYLSDVFRETFTI